MRSHYYEDLPTTTPDAFVVASEDTNIDDDDLSDHCEDLSMSATNSTTGASETAGSNERRTIIGPQVIVRSSCEGDSVGVSDFRCSRSDFGEESREEDSTSSVEGNTNPHVVSSSSFADFRSSTIDFGVSDDEYIEDFSVPETDRPKPTWNAHKGGDNFNRATHTEKQFLTSKKGKVHRFVSHSRRFFAAASQGADAYGVPRYRPGEKTFKRCLMLTFVGAVVVGAAAGIGGVVVGSRPRDNLENELAKFTDQELLEIAEKVALTCSDNVLKSEEGRRGCIDYCEGRLCCFDEEDRYGCAQDPKKLCALYAGCEVLVVDLPVVSDGDSNDSDEGATDPR